MNPSNWKKALPIAVAILTFFILTLAYFNPVLDGKRLKQGDIVHYKGAAQEMVEHREAFAGEYPDNVKAVLRFDRRSQAVTEDVASVTRAVREHGGHI